LEDYTDLQQDVASFKVLLTRS